MIYHTKDDIIKSSNDIFEISSNADIEKLRTHIKVGELCAYVIITTRADDKLYDHILLAKIKNVLEIGAKHMIIARYYNAKSSDDSELIKDDNVVSAGVIKRIDDKTFEFNLDSGPYISSIEPADKKKRIIGITTKFFSNISAVNNQISFKYNADTKNYTPPNITQVDVNELCKKKRMKCY